MTTEPKHPCIYCEDNNESEHFICEYSGAGMCDDCYDAGTEHDLHMFDYHETASEEEYKTISEKLGYESYGYMTFESYGILTTK